MKCLPFENLSYATRLSKAEIIKRLNDLVETGKNLHNQYERNRMKTYIGEVGENGFRLKRLISYRNSFLPSITGEFIEDTNGLTIKVKMRLHLFVLIFISIWLSFVGLASVAVIAAIIFAGFNPFFLIPVVMFIFGYALVTGGFKYESNKSKKIYKKYLKG